MDQNTLARVEFRQVFPFLWLFRTFRIALDVRKLLLGAAGLILVVQGNRLIDYLGMADGERPSSLELAGPALNEFENEILNRGALRPSPRDWDEQGRVIPPDSLVHSFYAWRPASSLFSPMFDGLAAPAAVLIAPATRFAPRVDALCRVLWFLLVWGLIGGAITRMAIHEFVLDERLGAAAAVGFATKRFIYFLTAPLLPFGGCVVLVLLCALGGLVGRIPGVGEWIVAVFWFVGLVLSVGIAIMLIGLVAGWPLMIAAVSTEDSDGFDGFSRAHSYVFDRPWHYLGYLVTAVVYGGLAVLFIEWASRLVVGLTELGIGLGAGQETTASLRDSSTMPGKIHAFWLAFLANLTIGFRVSFFWTSLLIIYLLLRKGVDNTPIKEAFLTQNAAGQDRQMALSGMASVREVVTERQVHNP